MKAFAEETAMGETKEPAVAKLGQTELSDTQRMMYAFGDSRRPKAETAKGLETVVLSQIAGIVTQVIHVSTGFSKAKIPLFNWVSHLSRLQRWPPPGAQRALVWRTCSSS